MTDLVFNLMTKPVRFYSAIFLGFFLISSAVNSQPSTSLADYVFISHQNQPVRMENFFGKFVIMNFTYTDCVMYCTTQTQQLKVLKSKLENTLDESKVVMLSVSLRPEQDSYKSLYGFAKRFSIENINNWLFVTGKPNEINALMKTLGVKVAFGASPSQVNHTTNIYLFDTKGKKVDEFQGIPLEDDNIIEKIKALNSVLL